MTTELATSGEIIPPVLASFSAYMPALDGLRAVAILFVIPHNTSVLSAHTSGFAYLVALIANLGWIGVQLFFALSGFLISGNLLDTRRAANYYHSFFARRVLRIFPLYFGSLLLICGLAPLIFHMPDEFTRTLRYVPIYLFFLSNWTQPFGLSIHTFPHFWSLAIEEQFYLAWPFIIYRTTPQRFLRICIAIVAAALVIRVGMLIGGAAFNLLYMWTTSRMDALAAGAALATIIRIPNLALWFKRRANAITMGTLVLLLAGAVTTHAYSNAATTQSFGYTILAIGFALIVALAAARSSGPFSILWSVLSIAPLRLIGRYSYAMYVFHLPLHILIGMPLLHRFVPHHSDSTALLYMAGLIVTTFSLAALSYHFYESRFLRLKKHFEPALSVA